MDLKSLIAFRATAVKNGHSGSHFYGHFGLDPGMIFMLAKRDAFI